MNTLILGYTLRRNALREDSLNRTAETETASQQASLSAWQEWIWKTNGIILLSKQETFELL